MLTRAFRPAVSLLIGAVAILAIAVPLGSQSVEEFARRQYESGLAFLREQRFAEALKDFQAVVDQYPASSVADRALLQIATYQLEVARDAEAASAPVELILKKYPTGEAAPMAHVLTGLILMSRGREADLDSALASFERVRRLFPGTDAVPAAMYHAAMSLRAFHREDEALVLYRQVATDYAASSYAAPALLGEGYCLLYEGRTIAAMEQWQRVRQRYPGTPQAQVAHHWNTIAYRLYLRAPAQPAYGFANRTIPAAPAKVKDGLGLAFGAEGVLHVATRAAVAAFDVSGQPTAAPVGGPSRGIAAGPAGQIWLLQRGGLQTPTGSLIGLGVPKPDGSLRPLDEIPAAVVTSFGELLAADRDAKTIARFNPAGQHLGVYAQVNAIRMTINPVDDVAALDRDDRSVALFDRQAALVKRLVAKGQGYTFGNPADLAFDALGHLYVLDRGSGAVHVFGPRGTFLTSFAAPPRSPGAFRRGTALGVDPAGRLFVYDDDTERVFVYQ